MRFRFPHSNPALLGALALTLLAARAAAEPFGITPGTDTPESLGCFPDTGTFYNCLTLPAPEAEIYYYKLQYHESLGYCTIMGVGHEVQSDASGRQMKELLELVANRVSQTFGSGQHVDVIAPGSTLRQSDDWMRSILAEERTYGWLWELPQPVEGIVEIGLSAYGISETSGYLVLEFHTPASADCDALDAAG